MCVLHVDHRNKNKSWAPIGSRRFLDVVAASEPSYFADPGVPMMRCMKNFLCQFGIPGDPAAGKRFRGRGMPDDEQWLPAGPDHMTNARGVRRFPRGYMAYAGGGKNSRSNQFIMSLADNKRLGGGSPWEVPWGELVGDSSFETVGSIYTGYGDNGPKQGVLSNRGADQQVRDEFPKLDYMTGCTVVEDGTGVAVKGKKEAGSDAGGDIGKSADRDEAGAAEVAEER